MRFTLQSHKENVKDRRYNKATNSFESDIDVNLW